MTTLDETGPLKIISLRASNFMRLVAVEIHPDGKSVVISGRNAQGKSSVLTAIWSALAGAKGTPAVPVRRGSEKAEVTIDLGEIVVTKKFPRDGKPSLHVEAKNGARFGSPQDVLNKLVGDLSFDPLAFARMDPKKQAETLRKMVPGLDFSALDGERAKLYEQRTLVNRDVTRLEGQLAGMPFPLAVVPESPEGEISLADLVAKHREVTETIHAQDALWKIIDEHKSALDACRDRLQAIAVEAKGLEKTAGQLLGKIEDARVVAEAFQAEHPPVNLDELQKRIDGAERHNALQRERRRDAEKADSARGARKAKEEELEATRIASNDLSAKISALDAKKRAAIAAAEFPVDGLSVSDDDMVIFNGLPLAAASSAEQPKVYLAVAAGLNPKLRVILVRDGSLLDAASMEAVAAWAFENDMQVIMERVATGEAMGVVIEDGQVVGAAEPVNGEART